MNGYMNMNKRILKNNFLQIEYLADSLRIIGLSPAGKPNLLADLSEYPPVPTQYGNFYFRGGHRLWHSPESMPRTYIPDTYEMEIVEMPDGVILETPTEPGTGIRKRIEIHLAPDKPSVTLTHTLINDGMWAVELAPWAITQFRLGGTVILPTPVGNVDEAGLLPNRQFSLWSYASLNDPRLKLGNEYIIFKADALLPPFKMGHFNQQGWMAYWLDDVLFRKMFEVQTEVNYPDNNCNAEMYCNDQFVELESLAPLGKLNPGEKVLHIENWELFYDLKILPDVLRTELGS